MQKRCKENGRLSRKYLQLDKLVKQLYIDACDSTGLVNTKGAKNGATFITDNAGKEDSFSGEDHPNFSKPEQTVNALRSLYYCSGPTRAGKMLRELIVYVNRMSNTLFCVIAENFMKLGTFMKCPAIFGWECVNGKGPKKIYASSP